MSWDSKVRRRCRVCHSDQLSLYLDLGTTPLANSYLSADQLSGDEFREKLAIQLCRRCGLSQLTHVVNPEKMYKHYLYVSSTPKTFRDHCEEFAQTAKKVCKLQPGDLVMDIASNDGCLLQRFKTQGQRVLGIEPAENLAPKANENGIPTLCEFWSTDTVKKVLKEGRPRVITSTNVFAHVDDVHGFTKAIKACLAEDGAWAIEMPYLIDFIKKNEFDTAYHEHLSYFAVHPLVALTKAHGLRVFHVEYFPQIHGGTIRVWISRPKTYALRPSVKKFLDKERKFGVRQLAPYTQFAKRIHANKTRLLKLLGSLQSDGKKVWAYGASAKGNTLMNYFGLTADKVPVALDDNPGKWGYHAPGSHMRIAGIDELKKDQVDYLLLLAWNFKTEIIRRCREAGYQGKFITPVPRAMTLNG